MSQIPSVIVGDLLSPQASEQIGVITGNLNAAADRAAKAAMQRAQLMAEKEMQEKAITAQQEAAELELSAKAAEYETYRKHQSLEAEKTRAHEQAMNADREAAAQKRQADVMASQEKLAKQAKELQLAEWDISARKAKAAADAASGLDTALAPLKKQRALNNEQLAVLEIELGQAYGQEKIDLAEFDRLGSELNQSRAMAGTAANQATISAIQSAINSTIIDEPKGIAKTFNKALQMDPSRLGTGVMAQVATNTFFSVFDQAAPEQVNALSNTSLMADKLIKELGPKLAGMTKNGTQADVNAALTNFFSAGIVAQQALAEDGVIKGADEEAALANFTKATAQLSGYVGNEPVQGILRGLKTATSDYEAGKLVSGKQDKTTPATKRARSENFKSLSRLDDVYQMARNQPNSPIAAAEYDEDMTGFVPKLIAAKADRSWSTQEFREEMKKLGVDQNLLKKTIAHFEANKDIDLPANVLRRMKDLAQENEGFLLDQDILSRRYEAEGIKAGAAAQSQAIDEYRAIFSK